MNKIIEYSKNKKYVAGAAIILIALVLIVFFSISTPKRTIKSFFKALENGDADKVAELIYINEKAIEEDGEEYVDEYDIDEYAEKIVDDLDGEELDYEIISIKEHAKTAKVKMEIEDDEGYIYLKKIDGKWKIDLYKTFLEVKKVSHTVTRKNNDYKYDDDDSDYDY